MNTFELLERLKKIRWELQQFETGSIPPERSAAYESAVQDLEALILVVDKETEKWNQFFGGSK